RAAALTRAAAMARSTDDQTVAMVVHAMTPAEAQPALLRVRRLVLSALDLTLPPRCIGCGERIDANGLACAACWSRLNFIAPPYCQCCGAPFAVTIEGEHRCASCCAAPPAYDRARAAVIYDDGSRGLVLGFKHGDRLQAAPLFGAWAARAGSELL